MKILFAFIISTMLASTAVGQPYLIKEIGWQQKIRKNYFLAPLFYGVKKTPAVGGRRKEFIWKSGKKTLRDN